MVMWYSSFGIHKNTRLCYSCIMVDLNCGHRINQEVKVWCEGFLFKYKPKQCFLAVAVPLLISHPHILNWCCNAQKLNVCCPLLCGTAAAFTASKKYQMRIYCCLSLGFNSFGFFKADSHTSGCILKSLFIPKTYKYAVPPVYFDSEYGGKVTAFSL